LEHELFLEGLQKYNKQWKAIAELVKTRTVVQIRTHAQKYFLKLQKSKSTDKNYAHVSNGGSFSFFSSISYLVSLQMAHLLRSDSMDYGNGDFNTSNGGTTSEGESSDNDRPVSTTSDGNNNDQPQSRPPSAQMKQNPPVITFPKLLLTRSDNDLSSKNTIGGGSNHCMSPPKSDSPRKRSRDQKNASHPNRVTPKSSAMKSPKRSNVNLTELSSVSREIELLQEEDCGLSLENFCEFLEYEDGSSQGGGGGGYDYFDDFDRIEWNGMSRDHRSYTEDSSPRASRASPSSFNHYNNNYNNNNYNNNNMNNNHSVPLSRSLNHLPVEIPRPGSNNNMTNNNNSNNYHHYNQHQLQSLGTNNKLDNNNQFHPLAPHNNNVPPPISISITPQSFNHSSSSGCTTTTPSSVVGNERMKFNNSSDDSYEKYGGYRATGLLPTSPSFNPNNNNNYHNTGNKPSSLSIIINPALLAQNNNVNKFSPRAVASEQPPLPPTSPRPLTIHNLIEQKQQRELMQQQQQLQNQQFSPRHFKTEITKGIAAEPEEAAFVHPVADDFNLTMYPPPASPAKSPRKRGRPRKYSSDSLQQSNGSNNDNNSEGGDSNSEMNDQNARDESMEVSGNDLTAPAMLSFPAMKDSEGNNNEMLIPNLHLSSDLSHLMEEEDQHCRSTLI
jgi:SHAQKYF class myb-like DNA-binding protein